MSNLNMILVLAMVSITLHLNAQDNQRIPASKQVEKSTSIKKTSQQKNVVGDKPIPLFKGDKGLKKSDTDISKPVNEMETKKEFSIEEKAMIQYKASLKSDGFYNSRLNIENRKKTILLKYLGIDSINDLNYADKKRTLAEQYPEKYKAFKKDMNSITISKKTK